MTSSAEGMNLPVWFHSLEQRGSDESDGDGEDLVDGEQ